MTHAIQIKLHNLQGGKLKTCPVCHGWQQILNPALPPIPPGEEEYFWEAAESGAYDIPCPNCKGVGTVPAKG